MRDLWRDCLHTEGDTKGTPALAFMKPVKAQVDGSVLSRRTDLAWKHVSRHHVNSLTLLPKVMTLLSLRVTWLPKRSSYLHVWKLMFLAAMKWR